MNIRQKKATREYSFLFIYHFLNSGEIFKDNLDELILRFNTSYNEDDEEKKTPKLSKVNTELSKLLISSCLVNKSEYTNLIQDCLNKKQFNKLNLIEQSLLLLATTELLTVEDTPSTVIISEYMKHAEKYATENSSKFLNGVIDAIIRKQSK